MIFLESIKKLIPYSLLRIMYKYKKSKDLNFYKKNEVVQENGEEYTEKVFYIIGFDEGWCGLYAIVMHQLTHIAYALDKGYVPVIDLCNFKNAYLQENLLGNENSWEYFFEQPMNHRLEDINKAKKVIYSVRYPDPPDNRYRISYAKTIYDKAQVRYWGNLFKLYIRFESSVEAIIKERRNILFANKGKVLGVILRGTDFITLKPSNHPVQPDIQEAILIVRQALHDWGCDYIYLATEDADIYHAFLFEFGHRLIDNESNRWTVKDLEDGKSNSDLFVSKEQKINEGIKYLSEIYCLSTCHSFIGGNTRGSLGALLMSNGFENQFIFDLGLYS